LIKRGKVGAPKIHKLVIQNNVRKNFTRGKKKDSVKKDGGRRKYMEDENEVGTD
jgi:hypothetical protein